MKISQWTQKGNKSTVKIEVDDKVWDADMNDDLVVQAVNVYRDNQRKGTAQAKTRSDVSGGGKKPWRQKGTGRARHGSIRSPLWVGGGVVFGPQSYKKFKKLPKKMKKAAMRGVLSQRLREEEIIILKSFEKMDKPSVKKFNEMLSDLDLTSEKLTIILPSDVEGFRMMLKSCSNLENIRIKRAIDVNIFDIMDCTKLLTSHPAVQELEERLA